jgi:hypothetical protein
MAISNHERVGRALNLLRDGLYPYIEREMKSQYGKHWLVRASTYLKEDRMRRNAAEILQQDLGELLNIINCEWADVFSKPLGQAERAFVNELKATRNHYAHGKPFSTDDTQRALDTAARLLNAFSSPEATTIEKQKQELLRVGYEDKARRAVQRAAVAPTEGQPMSGLKPWREIATPHPDVASGRYQQAEFAADLWQVYLDEGSDEYRLPTEFFRRTYLTDGLKQLLTGALLRLSGKGGDPVIELQTNFGGGKTHAMLALYHLFSFPPLSPPGRGAGGEGLLPGMEPLFQEADVNEPPQNVNTVVLVGNKISPGQIHQKSDGTQVRTLWGEIGWQLGGKAGYDSGFQLGGS